MARYTRSCELGVIQGCLASNLSCWSFLGPWFCFCVCFFFFFSSRRRHTRSLCDWSSDVCSSDLWLICPRCVQGAVGCTRATSHPTPPPMAAPPTTSVGKCWPAATRSAATAVAPANSSTVLRARWGRCSRRAIARYAVATENAAAAWPDGNERRLSRFEAAAGAADVYSTGRLRCASTLIHWVVASVHASALANTTTWPRTAAALAPSAEASPANPATATSSAWLAVPAGLENVCNAARSMPGSEAGSHGAQGGAPFGRPAARGSTASPLPAATPAASHQVTR